MNASLKILDWSNPANEILLKDRKSQHENNPLVIPRFGDFYNLRLSPWYQWVSYYRAGLPSSLTPVYIYLDMNEWTFFYCDIPRWKKEPIYKLSIFLDVYSHQVWCLLVLAGILSSCFPIKQFASNFLNVFGGLLCAGVSGISRNRPIILLWCFSIKPLVDIYTGELSSALVRQPEEEAIETLACLYDNSYSMLPSLFDSIEDRINLLDYMTSNETGRYFPSDYVNLKRLHSRIKTVSINIETVDRILLNTNEKVTVADDTFVTMLVANSLSYKTHQSEGLTCHLGKQPIYVGPFYWAFFPPNHLELASVFQRLVESGIVERMYQEEADISSSDRVQDRDMYNRLKKVNKGSSESEFFEVRLEQRIAKVFFLWSICLAICSFVFVMEYCWSRTFPQH